MLQLNVELSQEKGTNNNLIARKYKN